MPHTYALIWSHGTQDPHPPYLGLCITLAGTLIVFAFAWAPLTLGDWGCGPWGAGPGGVGAKSDMSLVSLLPHVSLLPPSPGG